MGLEQVHSIVKGNHLIFANTVVDIASAYDLGSGSFDLTSNGPPVSGKQSEYPEGGDGDVESLIGQVSRHIGDSRASNELYSEGGTDRKMQFTD